MIITIDGPAGSGKSTVADILAEQLGFIHFNSGALYRAVTAYLHENKFNIEHMSINSPIPCFEINVKMIDGNQHVFVNNKDYTPVLRNNEISTLVPFIGANQNCRKKVDECQKEFCSKHNVVMEGRDLGSFVFPNAEVKFYLDCSIEERARRRFLEEQEKHTNVTLEEIKEQIFERDEQDKNREIAPLVVPKDAIIVDSTHLSVEEVVAKMRYQIDNYR